MYATNLLHLTSYLSTFQLFECSIFIALNCSWKTDYISKVFLLKLVYSNLPREVFYLATYSLPVPSDTQGRDQSPPSISVLSHSFKVLRFNLLGLCLSCDGSFICFFVVLFSFFPHCFPYHACFCVCVGGILRTFNIVYLIDSAFALLNASS